MSHAVALKQLFSRICAIADCPPLSSDVLAILTSAIRNCCSLESPDAYVQQVAAVVAVQAVLRIVGHLNALESDVCDIPVNQELTDVLVEALRSSNESIAGGTASWIGRLSMKGAKFVDELRCIILSEAASTDLAAVAYRSLVRIDVVVAQSLGDVAARGHCLAMLHRWIDSGGHDPTVTSELRSELAVMYSIATHSDQACGDHV